MKIFFSSCNSCLLVILVICLANIVPGILSQVVYRPERVTCTKRGSRCYNEKITCPQQCPIRRPTDPNAPMACFINCESPQCKGECRYRKPNCKGIGAACYDPRFVGADGAVFYFHGKSNQHFTLFSDTNLHINARFIGHRPAGRPRDNTWIQSLGLLFGSHNLSVHATKATAWDATADHLTFSVDGRDVVLPQSAAPSSWQSEAGDVMLERTASANSATITVPELVEIAVSAVPITKKDDAVHNYQLPADDCFSHLEVQFRFLDLSPEVEGVLGRTYRPDYDSRGKLGLGMAVVGGEKEYGTTSLFAVDCKKCGVFSGEKKVGLQGEGMVDCSGKYSGGNGIACRK